MDEIFTDPLYINWIKCTLALVKTKQSVESYVEKKCIAYFQKYLSLPDEEKAHLKLKRNEHVCKYHIKKKKNWEIETNCVTYRRIFKQILDLKLHSASDHICWSNIELHCLTDVSNSWAIAKLFMPSGNKGSNDPSTTDAAAIFNVINICPLFAPTDHTILDKLVLGRNTIMHSSDSRVTDAFMKYFFKTLHEFLEFDNWGKGGDTSLKFRTECQECAKSIQELYKSKIVITSQMNDAALEIKDKSITYDKAVAKANDGDLHGVKQIYRDDQEVESKEHSTSVESPTHFEHNSKSETNVLPIGQHGRHRSPRETRHWSKQMSQYEHKTEKQKYTMEACCDDSALGTSISGSTISASAWTVFDIDDSHGLDESANSIGPLSFDQGTAKWQQLHPIVFDIPHYDGKPAFIGRGWVYKNMYQWLNSDNQSPNQSSGVIITGGRGSGKTALIYQLVRHSCFNLNEKYNITSKQNTHGKTMDSTKSLTDDTLHRLGSQVVACHFCQPDNKVTCLVPNFVQSLACYLAHAPKLRTYREMLLQNKHLQQVLSLRQCVKDPTKSLIKGILEPLAQIKLSGKPDSDFCIILIDAINEADIYKPDHGYSISSFIVKHVDIFPRWLKLVLTTREITRDTTDMLSFPRIYIDRVEGNELISRDIHEYIKYRAEANTNLKQNITQPISKTDCSAEISSYLQKVSNGSFLLSKVTLDLIVQGYTSMASLNEKSLPLRRAFLLQFNLKFPSIRSFERVTPLLCICVATRHPLTSKELFHVINSGETEELLLWSHFQENLDLLSGILYKRTDSAYAFFDLSLRDWLTKRETGETEQYLCDVRRGHDMMALYFARTMAPLSADETLELGYHILRGDLFKNMVKYRGCSSHDMMARSSKNLSASLVCPENIYSPDIEVSRLILQAGANPNTVTDLEDNLPAICVLAKEGYIEMVTLLLEYNANVNAVSQSGISAMCYAASNGHVEIIEILCKRNGQVNHIDNNGQSAVAHAAAKGHIDAVVSLLCDWPMSDGKMTQAEAIQQGKIFASAAGHHEIYEYLLNFEKYHKPCTRPTVIQKES